MTAGRSGFLNNVMVTCLEEISAIEAGAVVLLAQGSGAEKES